MAKVVGGGPAGKRRAPTGRALIYSLGRRPAVRASAPAIPKPPTTTAKARVGQTVTDAMRNAPAARKALAGVLRKKS
jgi:hypothetical protein